MMSIVFICPYFGKLPKNQFPLWLKSCEYNNSINWIIFTDDRTKYNYPNNVEVIYLNFSEFKDILQKKFSFSICLERPYKLCDFKPTYGYVFEEYISKYDYWGYCDISDTIFGDLRKFLTDKNLKQADKIMYLGHMTLYRNTKDVNRRFMLKTKENIPLELILGVKDNMIFDEFSKYGINYIYMEHNFPIKVIDNMLMDVAPLSKNFKIHCITEDYKFYDPDNKGRIFVYKKGKLYAYELQNKKIKKIEIGYLHFQLRYMKAKVSSSADSFMIVPNKFIPLKSEVNVDIIKKYTKEYFFNSPYFIYYYKELKKKFVHLKEILKKKYR